MYFEQPSSGGSVLVGTTTTGATQGSVFFAGVGGVLQQDNANFFWDDTNNRLGLGTATPQVNLSIAGAGVSFRGFGNCQTVWTGNSHVLVMETSVGSTTAIAFSQINGQLGFWTSPFGSMIQRMSIQSTGQIIVTPSANVSNSTAEWTHTGAAHSSNVASTEVNSLNFNLSATQTWATGALATQRAFLIQAPTYAFAGASVLASTSTFNVSANPAAGANCTITASWAIQAGGDVAGGPTSAGQKYAAFNAKAHTVTVTGSTQVTQAGSFSQIRLDQLTITDASAVVIDAAANLYIAGPVIATGSVTLTDPYSVWVDAGRSRFDGSILQSQGADVASANNLVLGSDGNVFEITGTTQVNLISNIIWQNGAVIVLLFTSNPTVKHNQATSTTNITIQLAGAADFVASSGDTLTLVLSEIGGTQAWREITRCLI